MKKNLFNSVQYTRPKKNRFDLSHDHKLSCNMGQLVPVMCLDCVPGDRITIGCEMMVRFAPMIAPIMHRVDATVHYFAVPKRLLWSGWEKWITGNNGNALPAFPTIEIGVDNYTRLADHFGIPNPSPGFAEVVSAMPFSAYTFVCNEYYRDQNMQNPFMYELSDGDNSANSQLLTLRNRCWEHDYFTAALPSAQMGASVDVPLGDVKLKDDWYADDQKPFFEGGAFGLPAVSGGVSAGSTGGLGAEPLIVGDTDPTGTNPFALDPNGSLEVGATTINDLRRAFRLQEWLEKTLRAGKRYIEHIWSMFGVRSSDQRLQRPEYITGVKQPVSISEVLNTTGTDTAPQGTMAGHGIGIIPGSKYGGYYCEEHMYIIGIMSVMPKTAYSQGIPKHFYKINDPFEHYWPQFANIGEQEVKKGELYAFNGVSEDLFGYVPRYAEYKFESNRVSGDMRSSLNFWHMAREFATEPMLNSQFVVSNPTNRIFAVEDENVDHLWIYLLNKVDAIRPMPKFGTPMF